MKNTLPASLYYCCQTRPPELHSLVWLVCRQPVGNELAAPGEASNLLRLLFSIFIHIHPSWPARQTLCSPHPPFPRSTGLVKVSQSPVALLYRLQCFLFKWRLLSCEYPCKEWACCFHPPFVWSFWSQSRQLALVGYIP